MGSQKVIIQCDVYSVLSPHLVPSAGLPYQQPRTMVEKWIVRLQKQHYYFHQTQVSKNLNIKVTGGKVEIYSQIYVTNHFDE